MIKKHTCMNQAKIDRRIAGYEAMLREYTICLAGLAAVQNQPGCLF